MSRKTVRESLRIFGLLTLVFLSSEFLTMIFIASLFLAACFIFALISLAFSGDTSAMTTSLFVIPAACIAAAIASWRLRRRFNPPLRMNEEPPDIYDPAEARRLLRSACPDRLEELVKAVLSDSGGRTDECRAHCETCPRCREALDSFFAAQRLRFQILSESLGRDAEEPPRPPVDYDLLLDGACPDRAGAMKEQAFYMIPGQPTKFLPEELRAHVDSCVGCLAAAERIAQESNARFYEGVVQVVREKTNKKEN